MRLGRSRIRSDLIEAFKIINGYYDITLDPFFKKINDAGRRGYISSFKQLLGTKSCLKD